MTHNLDLISASNWNLAYTNNVLATIVGVQNGSNIYAKITPIIVSTVFDKRIISVAISTTIPTGKTWVYAGIASGTVLQSAEVMIIVNVQPHKVYQRNGNDLHREVEIDCFGAMLGTSVVITTLNDEKLKLTIPAGTQFGTQLKLGGKGIDANGIKGNIICHIKVVTPKLTDEQRKVLEGMMPITV